MRKWIGKIKRKIYDIIFNFFRKIRNKKKIKNLKNRDVTILSSDCLGGVIYHDLNLKFMSPTINLYMVPKDFIKFCKNLDFYLNKKIVEIKNRNHIVGKLEDIELHFLHYSSFDEACKKWYERAKRINFNNICIILTCKYGYTKNDIENFEKLNFQHKIIFTPKKYNKYNCSYYIEGSENGNDLEFLGTKVNIFGKKIIDDFDIVSFLNGVKQNEE